MSTATTMESVEELGRAIGVREDEEARGWLERLVSRRMKRSLAKARAKRAAGAYAAAPAPDRARSIVRWACAKAALTGAISGAASTAATVLTAETEGVAGVVAIPAGIAAIGAEMLVRAIVHVDLACELAEVFEVRVDENDEEDVLRLLSLALGAPKERKHEDLGKSMVEVVTSDEKDEVFERAGNVLLGESVLRNVLPFVGIVSSAVTNVIVTYKLGQTLRRSFRYERAMLDALREGDEVCASCIDLLIEGLWFVFTADGRLSSEETACLAHRLDDLDPIMRRAIIARFTADEGDWFDRLPQVPEEARDTFLRVLEVAAALDKEIELPEQKILRRVAKVLGRTYDPKRVLDLVELLERTGSIG